MEIMKFVNNRKGNPNPNVNGKQRLWQEKKPFIPNNLPNGEQLQWRHPDNNKSYYHLCRFDLPPKHTSKSCPRKEKGYKNGATIHNHMGGTTCNCFHHPDWATLKNKNWRHGKEEKMYNSTNNNNNISQQVVQSKFPSCKRNLAALVTSNIKYNSVQKSD